MMSTGWWHATFFITPAYSNPSYFLLASCAFVQMAAAED
jgi:hypothetical protein